MLSQVSQSKAFGGSITKYSLQAKSLQCESNVNVFTPATATVSKPAPVLFYLSGLTCNEDNFAHKAGAFQHAAHHNIVLVMPDTSPRGKGCPGDTGDWTFGEGAGYYVDATNANYAPYRMFEYVSKELPEALGELRELDLTRVSIMGHSMGGHGAIILALRTQRFRSVSVFAAMAHMAGCPWGQAAYERFFGPREMNQAAWELHDGVSLLKSSQAKVKLLMDQGTKDPMVTQQLLPEKFLAAAAEAGYQIKRLKDPPADKVEGEGRKLSPGDILYVERDGYDHGYNFIATFTGEHIAFHAHNLHA